MQDSGVRAAYLPFLKTKTFTEYTTLQYSSSLRSTAAAASRHLHCAGQVTQAPAAAVAADRRCSGAAGTHLQQQKQLLLLLQMGSVIDF